MRAQLHMSTSPTSTNSSAKPDFSVIPTDFVFLRNPSPKLIKALGKTEADLEPDRWGRENLRWLNLPSLDPDIKIYYGFKETFLLEEVEEESESAQEAPSNTVPFEIPGVPKKPTKVKRGKWKRFA